MRFIPSFLIGLLFIFSRTGVAADGCDPLLLAQAQFQTYLSEISVPGWIFDLRLDDTRLYLQARFDDYDSYSEKWIQEKSGKRYLSVHMTKNEIVQQALALSLSAVEHQVRKNFFYREMRIFGPHFNIDSLVATARASREQPVSQETAKDHLAQWLGNIQSMSATIHLQPSTESSDISVIEIATRDGTYRSEVFIRNHFSEMQAVQTIFRGILSTVQDHLRTQFLVQGEPIFSPSFFRTEDLAALCEADCLDRRKASHE